MAHKYAKYRGQRFKVLKEDGKFVTLEGYGYSKRHQVSDVIFEEIPEEKMLVPKEETLLPPSIVDEVLDLPKEREDLELIKDATHDARDVADNHPEGEVEVPVANDPPFTQTPGMEGGTKNFPNYPKMGIDVTSITPDDRHEEDEKRRAHSINEFQKRLEEVLGMMDSTKEHLDTECTMYEQDPSLKAMDDIDKLEEINNLDGVEPPMVTDTAMPIQPLEEEGGTASVAGAGCADGTNNPAIIGEQGIARFDARLGASPTKRKNT
jgi:hypothetical protein